MLFAMIPLGISSYFCLCGLGDKKVAEKYRNAEHLTSETMTSFKPDLFCLHVHTGDHCAVNGYGLCVFGT